MRSQSSNLPSEKNCPWTDQYEFFPDLASTGLLTIPSGKVRPATLSNPNNGSVPGESSLYNDYGGKAAPFPANMSAL
jgi:hypothetical protein